MLARPATITTVGARTAGLVIFLGAVACGTSSAPPDSGQSDAAPEGGGGGDAASDGPGVDATPDGDGGTNTAGPVGASCTPAQELSSSFGGFALGEVTVEANNPTCGAGNGRCLVNHFQGRTTCPYGQNAAGMAPPPAAPCTVPGTGQAVSGQVKAQCTDRRASSAVYCSCRCANAEGRTDDGAAYCACPGSFTCTQLITPIGSESDDISGAYCVEDATEYDASSSCAETCSASSADCP